MAARRKSPKPPIIPPKAPPEAVPNIDHLMIDDGAPVDGSYSEKQMRLLTVPLYSSWAGPGAKRSFLALANVGLFYQVDEPPLVPDVMLSVDVQARKLSEKRNNTYFVWEFGKSPEVIVEIVSNKVGNEMGEKLTTYAHIGVSYYVVWDPMNHLKMGKLQSFVQRGKQFKENGMWFKETNLGMTKWEGVFEGIRETWIRWTDERGRLILTGAEQLEQSRKRIKKKDERIKLAETRAKEEKVYKQKALEENERLKAQLRALGVQPEEA